MIYNDTPFYQVVPGNALVANGNSTNDEEAGDTTLTA